MSSLPSRPDHVFILVIKVLLLSDEKQLTFIFDHDMLVFGRFFTSIR